MPSDYCLPVCCGKTRMIGLPDGEKSLTMFTRFDRMYELGKRTHGQIAHSDMHYPVSVSGGSNQKKSGGPRVPSEHCVVRRNNK